MAPQREWFEKDYYAELGIERGASDRDIQKAYRKLAKEFHPDANAGDAAAEERFKQISAAHEVLGDAEKRKEYDQVREMVANGVGPNGPGGFGEGFGPGFEGATFHFDEGGGLGDLFGNLFGGGGGGGVAEAEGAAAVGGSRPARSAARTSRPSSTSTSSTPSTASPRRSRSPRTRRARSAAARARSRARSRRPVPRAPAAARWPSTRVRSRSRRSAPRVAGAAR